MSRSAPVQFLRAALWPVTVWPSLARADEHPADDYVGRTTPIIACAIAFWACVAGLVFLYTSLRSRMVVVTAEGVDVHVLLIPQNWQTALGVVLLFTPLIYGVGFWLFTKREEKY